MLNTLLTYQGYEIRLLRCLHIRAPPAMSATRDLTDRLSHFMKKYVITLTKQIQVPAGKLY